MSSPEVENFRKLLQDAWGDLPGPKVERVVRFYRLVLTENEQQNLTRLISPKDFLEGHVLDVKALLKSGMLSFPAMDLGSGGGVPGLLAAALTDDSWVLAESEGRKAAFLSDAADSLGLKNVTVHSGRGEDYLKGADVASIVARAVGPVERIYAWLKDRSTWNNLILLKGPGWDEEWKSFEDGRHRGALEIQSEYNYSTGDPPKRLRIVRLIRPGKPARK